MVRRLVAAALVLATGAAACAGEPGVRTVRITIHFSRFAPDRVTVAPGETVRFVIENTDPIDHEFILGDEAVQRRHEEGTEASHGAVPGEVTVPALTTRETTFTFPQAPVSLAFACHLPGHFAYGMVGVAIVSV
jgi:uncharacterized cupredoxin-like copper-binding protein